MKLHLEKLTMKAVILVITLTTLLAPSLAGENTNASTSGDTRILKIILECEKKNENLVLETVLSHGLDYERYYDGKDTPIFCLSVPSTYANSWHRLYSSNNSVKRVLSNFNTVDIYNATMIDLEVASIKAPISMSAAEFRLADVVDITKTTPTPSVPKQFSSPVIGVIDKKANNEKAVEATFTMHDFQEIPNKVVGAHISDADIVKVHDSIINILEARFKDRKPIKRDANGYIKCEVTDIKKCILKDGKFFEMLQFQIFFRSSKARRGIDLDLCLDARYASGTSKPSDYKEMDNEYSREMKTYTEEFFQEFSKELRKNLVKESKLTIPITTKDK